MQFFVDAVAEHRGELDAWGGGEAEQCGVCGFVELSADGPVDFKGELRPLFLIGRTGELVSRQTLEVVEHYRSLTISVEPGWQIWTCFARRQLSNQ